MKQHKEHYNRRILHIFAVPCAAVLVALCGCDDLVNTIKTGGSTATTVELAEDLPDSMYVKNLGSETTLTLHNVQGKTLVYVNFNNHPTSTILYSYTRRLTNATGVNTTSSNVYALGGGTNSGIGSGITSGTGYGTSWYWSLDSGAATQGGIAANRSHFFPPEGFTAELTASVARNAARAGGSTEALDEKTTAYLGSLRVGHTKKQIFVDTDVNISNFGKKQATLQAIGYDSDDGSGNPICLVWVVDENYNEQTAGGEIINSDIANKLAKKFAEHYAHERAVFGEEYDYLIDRNGYSYETAEYVGDTGSLVNIVVYDIGNDYTESGSNTNSSSDNECGVVGYFYAKDYYKATGTYTGNMSVANYSNAGKYFYIDAAYCNYSQTDESNVAHYNGATDSDGSPIVSDTVISTLFHEFQHMIHFNQKTIRNGLSTSTWYNEMLSMLAEDMMQNQLGLSNEEAPRGSRLPAFNMYYYTSGIDEYLGNVSSAEQYAVLSYSTAYAFGAWLAREFGGPEFVQQVSQNDSGDMDSILAAIKTQKDETYTDRQLYKKYIQACVFRNPFAYEQSLPSFDKDPGGNITAGNYTSKITAIDLFGADLSYAVASTKCTGPLIFANGTNPNSLTSLSSTVIGALRPHGFVIHSIGTATTDTVVLTFSAQRNPYEDVMVYVQDSFSNKVN